MINNNSFQQHRAKVLGKKITQVSPVQKSTPQSFQQHRESVLKNPVKRTQVQQTKIITPSNPIKKDEPGGLFEMIGNAVPPLFAKKLGEVLPEFLDTIRLAEQG